jgi:hypothetical protein
MNETKLEGWGIVELMGHQRTAGRLSERSIAGSNLLQVDVPVSDTEFRTVFYGGSAIYALHPTDEQSARLMARSLGQRPVYAYDIAQQQRLSRMDDDRDDSDRGEDDGN